MVISPQSQINATEVCEHAARAALKFLWDPMNSSQRFTGEAMPALAEYMDANPDNFRAVLITFCEALAVADKMGEDLGAERGELLAQVFENLRMTYYEWRELSR